MAIETQDFEEALRQAKPSWLNAPEPNAQGIQTRGNPPSIGNVVDRRPISTRSQYQAPFPDATETTTTDATVVEDNSEYSFQFSLVAVDQKAYTVKINVAYGEIGTSDDKEPPDGMTLETDYVFTIPGSADETEIYAVVTYDTTTLKITSRSLAFGFEVPDPTFGVLYVPIGVIYIEYSNTGAIKNVIPHNRFCGDINIGLTTGAVNGVAGLFTFIQLADPVSP